MLYCNQSDKDLCLTSISLYINSSFVNMGVIDMVLFVFHPMPDASEKHKMVLYPIKRIYISA